MIKERQERGKRDSVCVMEWVRESPDAARDCYQSNPASLLSCIHFIRRHPSRSIACCSADDAVVDRLLRLLPPLSITRTHTHTHSCVHLSACALCLAPSSSGVLSRSQQLHHRRQASMQADKQAFRRTYTHEQQHTVHLHSPAHILKQMLTALTGEGGTGRTRAVLCLVPHSHESILSFFFFS